MDTFRSKLVLLAALGALLGGSSCQQCVTTDCGGGRSATWCTKQGKECPDCQNHKLTDENGKTLYGCEYAYENGKVVSCKPFIERDIVDYCASGKVCTGLNGSCSKHGDCCTGFCGDTKHCSTLP